MLLVLVEPPPDLVNDAGPDWQYVGGSPRYGDFG